MKRKTMAAFFALCIAGAAAAQTAYLEKDHSKEEVREQYEQLLMEALSKYDRPYLSARFEFTSEREPGLYMSSEEGYTLIVLQMGRHISLWHKISLEPFPEGETSFPMLPENEETLYAMQRELDITAFLVKVQAYLTGFREEADQVIDWIMFKEDGQGTYQAYILDGETWVPFLMPFSMEKEE
jgi:hypothetical protein